MSWPPATHSLSDVTLEDALRYLELQIGNERLCPPRARLVDWNRSIQRMIDEIRTLDKRP